MRVASLPIVIATACLVGCQSSGYDGRKLAWLDVESGPSCYAGVRANTTADGGSALEIVTKSLPDDKAGMEAIVLVHVARVDGEPLSTLGELAAGGSLLVDMLRDERSGGGLPAFSMPFVSLWVHTAKGDRVELIWETAYNGYPPRTGVFPVGTWLRDIAVHEGVFWMRSHRNFNGKDGFQPLSAWVGGHVTTWQNESTTLLDADAQITGIEIGFGNGVPGIMHAWVDNLRLTVAGQRPYVITFEDEVRPVARVWRGGTSHGRVVDVRSDGVDLP